MTQKTFFKTDEKNSCYNPETKDILSEINRMKEAKHGHDWFKNHEYKKRNGRKKRRKKRGKR